jgi:hypothetical protein
MWRERKREREKEREGGREDDKKLEIVYGFQFPQVGPACPSDKAAVGTQYRDVK